MIFTKIVVTSPIKQNNASHRPHRVYRLFEIIRFSLKILYPTR